MAGLDLGKQVGPMPLGAWIVVVAGGLGIAYWTKSHGNVPETVTDTGGQPGVGDGTVGGWVPTSPQTGTDGGNAAGNKAPTTNEEWAYQAKQVLIGLGYPATTVSSAIDKYVNGLTPSVQEYTLVGIALAKVGPLPQALPIVAEPDPEKPPTGTPSAGTVINPPSVLKASNVTRTTVWLTWSAPVGNNKSVVGYRIFWTPGGRTTTTIGRSKLITGLKSNTDYGFQVSSIAIDGTVSKPGPYAKFRTKR